MLEIQIIHKLVCVCSLIVHPYTSLSLYQHLICSSSLFYALISITEISANAYMFVPFLLLYLILSSWLSHHGCHTLLCCAPIFLILSVIPLCLNLQLKKPLKRKRRNTKPSNGPTKTKQRLITWHIWQKSM